MTLERCHTDWWRFAAAVQDVAPHLRNDMLREYAKELYPHLCEDFPDETPEVLGWLGCACWANP